MSFFCVFDHFRSERSVSTIFPPYIMPNGTYERKKKIYDTLPLTTCFVQSQSHNNTNLLSFLASLWTWSDALGVTAVVFLSFFVHFGSWVVQPSLGMVPRASYLHLAFRQRFGRCLSLTPGKIPSTMAKL